MPILKCKAEKEAKKTEQIRISQELQKQQHEQFQQQLAERHLPETITTYAESLVYAKKLIVTMVSSITYLRALLPEHMYADKVFDGIHLKIIKPWKGDPKMNDARIIDEWLIGAFEAMDLRYLKRMSLSIFENKEKPEEVLETYDFYITYTDKSVKLVLETSAAKQAGKKAELNARRMIRSIGSTSQSLHDLPDIISLNMKLFYYDERTPVDYEPSHYKRNPFGDYVYNGRVKVDGGKVDCHWIRMNFAINVAQSMVRQIDDFNTIDETFDTVDSFTTNGEDLIKTVKNKQQGTTSVSSNSDEQDVPTSSASARIKVIKHRMDVTTNSVFAEKTSPETEEAPLDEIAVPAPPTPAPKKVHKKGQSPQNNENLPPAKVPASKSKKIVPVPVENEGMVVKDSSEDVLDNVFESSMVHERSSIENRIVQCGCQLTDRENLLLLQCEVCQKWQHAVCYKLNVTDENASFAWLGHYKHVCSTCQPMATQRGLKATEPTLKGRSPKDVQDLMVWRRLLSWLLDRCDKMVACDAVAAQFKLSTDEAFKQLKRLEKEGCAKCIDKSKKVFMVIQSALVNKADKYFIDIRVGFVPEPEEKTKRSRERAPASVETSPDEYSRMITPRTSLSSSDPEVTPHAVKVELVRQRIAISSINGEQTAPVGVPPVSANTKRVVEPSVNDVPMQTRGKRPRSSIGINHIDPIAD